MAISKGRLIRAAKESWNDLSEAQRDLWRLALIAIGLGGLGAAAWWGGKPWWHRMQREQALEQAKAFAQERDFRSTALALRRALELSPQDPAAWREAVALLSELGAPEVLPVREHLSRLTPEDTAVKLAVISDALRLERWDTAEATWSELATMTQRDAAFYRLGAALATAMGRVEEVESNLKQLIELAPDDKEARFNYAALRLWSPVPEVRRAAKQALQGLLDQPTVRIRAALELLKAAARTADPNRAFDAMTHVGQVFAPGEALDFTSPGQPGWARLLNRLREVAVASGPRDIATVARWLADIGHMRETLLWIEGLPEALTTSAPVADIAAQFSAELGDLDRLEQRLRAGAWGVWPRDVLTLAMAARLQRLRYTNTNGRATWDDALTATKGSIPALRALMRLAVAWRDPASAERTLSKVIEVDPRSFWAYLALRDIYASRGDLPKLLGLFDQWARTMPLDDHVAATWITLGAILNRLSPVASARAEALHQKDPKRVEFAVPLAAVRWRENKPEVTIAVLRQLDPEDQDRSAVALWMFLALADTSDAPTAELWLARAARADLTTEEAALVRAAAQKLGLSLPGRS